MAATPAQVTVEPRPSEDLPRVEAEELGKMFRIYRRPYDRLRDWLTPRRRKYHAEFWALRGVSFSLKAGEALGVIGPNGSGKTTLLKMVAGVTRPTEGRLTIRGRTAALLELGAGFHHEFTGRQNIRLNARLLGLSEEEIEQRIDDIIAFAELEQFIDQPVRTYSWGMYVRLGFAVASFVDPDILIIDEALAVGDLYFQRKSLDRIEYFRRIGKTILFVSHEMRLVRRFCDRALWLEEGKVAELGPTAEVVRAYEMHMKQREVHLLGATATGVKSSPPASPQELERRRRMRVLGQSWGSGEVIITKVELFGADGRPKWVFDLGERLTIRIYFFAFQRVENPQFGVNIHRIDGTYVYGANNFNIHPHRFGPIEGPGAVDLVIDKLLLHKGRYFLSVGAYLEPDDPFWSYPADWHHQMYEFRVFSEMAQHGVVALEGDWREPSPPNPSAWGVPSRLEADAGARFLRRGWQYDRESGLAFSTADAEALIYLPPRARQLLLTASAPHQDLHRKPLSVAVSLGGRHLGAFNIDQPGEHTFSLPIPSGTGEGLWVVRISVDRTWPAPEPAAPPRGIALRALWVE